MTSLSAFQLRYRLYHLSHRVTLASYRIPAYAVAAHGVLKNYNTIEEFKAADKTALFNELSDEVRVLHLTDMFTEFT